MEKLKSPGMPARDASSVALADESMAMNVPATKVTASKTPRIEEMERRRLRRTSRAAYGRRPKVPSTLALEKGGQAIRALARGELLAHSPRLRVGVSPGRAGLDSGLVPRRADQPIGTRWAVFRLPAAPRGRVVLCPRN